MPRPAVPAWDSLLDQVVVLDLNGPYVYIGRFMERQGDFLVLHEADAHDLRDSPTKTREQYIVDCHRHGVPVNRKWVWVHLSQIVGVSRLDDVTLC